MPRREFRGMTMVEIGRELLSERGISTRGMDRSEVAKTFFSRAHSTSDFPLLFEGVINKMLRAQYEFAPEFWDKIARQTSVDDFRARGLYSAGVVNGMKKIPEGGEIKYTTLKESKETIRVETFGEGISYTRRRSSMTTWVYSRLSRRHLSATGICSVGTSCGDC